MRHGTRGDQVEIGSQVEKRRPGIKMAEKGPKKFSRFMRHFPTTYYSFIHSFILFSFITQSLNRSQINRSLIVIKETLDSLLSLIPFLLLLTRNIVIDFDGLESMNEWQGRKREVAIAAATSTATTTTIVVVVVVSNGPNYLSNDLINNQNLQYEIISNQSD